MKQRAARWWWAACATCALPLWVGATPDPSAGLGGASSANPAYGQPVLSDQDRARMRSQQWLRVRQQEADQVNDLYGKDDRGRSYAQDIREYVTAPMERLLDTLNELTPEQQAQWQLATTRDELLKQYWSELSRLRSARAVWPDFLRLNHFTAATQHNDTVTTLETQLATLLRGEPAASWAQQVGKLSDAYFDERKQLLQGVSRDAGEFTARKSTCPTAAAKTSGKSTPAFAPGTALPDNYPAASRRHAQEGYILLMVRINEHGCATGAHIIGSSGFEALDGAAMELYESMRFLPAEKNGQAVTTSIAVPVRYRLEQ